MDGELSVWLGKDQVSLRPGEQLTIPIGTAHVVSVIGDGPADALVIASPSGFARVISEAGVPNRAAPGRRSPQPIWSACTVRQPRSETKSSALRVNFLRHEEKTTT